MTISLQSFATGDTDYVAKMNTNMTTIQDAINALQTAMGVSTVAGAVSFDLLLRGLFGSYPTFIGASSYGASISDSDKLVITAGYAWKPSSTKLVQLIAPATLDFMALTDGSGTYYIVLDDSGNPSVSTSSSGAYYSVAYTRVGLVSTINSFTLLAKIFADITEEESWRDIIQGVASY